MQFTTMFLLATGANAATVLMTYTTTDGRKVWSVDTKIGSSHLIANVQHDPHGPWGSVNGVVCNNVYYSTWTQSSGFGLHALALASGESWDLATESEFHVLACDPHDDSKLLAIAAPRYGHGVGDFHLKSYNPATQTEAVVGTFPAEEAKWAGEDSIFSFTQDGSEVWASWPMDGCPTCTDAKEGGHVHIMDTSSGEIKTSSDLAFSGKTRTPYLLLPDAKRGAFITNATLWSSVELKWADLEVVDGSIKAKIDITDASALYHPVQSVFSKMCGDQLLSLSTSSKSTEYEPPAATLNTISPATGLIIDSVDLLTALDIEYRDISDISALACLKSSTEDFALV